MDAVPPRSPPGRALVARRLPGWGAQAMLVLRKDLAIEARSGEVVVTSGFFALLVVILSIRPQGLFTKGAR